MSNQDDDDVEYNNTSGIMKWIPTIMLVSVIAGFVMIAYYAYNSGKQQPLKDDDLLVVEAEKTPVKEKPEDPGGMKFPNQDKTIFETFSNSPTPPKVERVLPAPEEPITSAEPAAGTPENAETPKAEETPDNNGGNNESVISDNNAESNKTESAEKSDKKESSATEVKKVEAVGVDDRKPAETKTEAKPATGKPKAGEQKSAAKSGGLKIQLGAYASEKEATETWHKIQKRFPSIAGKTSSISRADVKGKTFYRLRLGGFADKAAATELCKNLSAKGQGCMLAVD